MKLEQALASIRPLDQNAMEQAQRHWNNIAKPLHSLGRLEEAVIQIAGITGTPQVRLDRPCGVVMCADNGVVAQGVTQSGQDITAIVTENLAKGNTSVCAMAVLPLFRMGLAVYHEMCTFEETDIEAYQELREGPFQQHTHIQ